MITPQYCPKQTECVDIDASVNAFDGHSLHGVDPVSTDQAVPLYLDFPLISGP